jgi:hypothetical protein
MDNETTVSNLVKYSFEQKPLEFQQEFDSLVKDRIAKAIEDKKIEVAQSIFSDQEGPDDYNDDDDNNAEYQDEFDFEEDDIDDELLNQEEDQDGETA